MGCIHGKCCSHYPPSDGDASEIQELGPFNGENTHSFGNHPHILTERSLEFAPVPSHNFRLESSVITQRGYYPNSPNKMNEDSFCIRTQIQDNPNLHFFGVFDGHGPFGTRCSNFVSERLIQILSNDSELSKDPVKAYNSAFSAVNSQLHNSEIDDTMSGTTAITVLVSGDTLFVANVGDSRAVIAVKSGNHVIAKDLSHDHTPFRKDEYERAKLCGARVLSVDQVEGLDDPDIQSWNDEGDPPRLWVKNAMYPGTAFTRSVGDSRAEKIGVIAVPEVSIVQLMPNHLFFVIASDGVFDFLSSQAVVNMVMRFTDPRDACAAIAGEAYKLWLEHENRTDDITIIIVHIKDISNSGAGATNRTSKVNVKRSRLMMGKGSPDVSVSTGSEVFYSMRSNFSDMQPRQRSSSAERNPASVGPSLTHTTSYRAISS